MRGPEPRGFASFAAAAAQAFATRAAVSPADASDSTGTARTLIGLLQTAYAALPPIARVTLASQVRMWAERSENEARTELERQQWQQPGTYDTTGRSWP